MKKISFHLFFSLFLFIQAIIGKAQNPGTIDRSYANNGFQLINIVNPGSSNDRLSDVESMGTGKLIYIAYNYNNYQNYIGRLDSSGNKDLAFGSQGITLIPGVQLSYRSIIVKKNKLIQSNSDTSCIVLSHALSNSFTVHKFNNKGNYDSTFGVNGQTQVTVTKPILKLAKAVYQSDGKILVLIGSVNSPTNDDADLLIVRLKTNGTRDSTFGTNGIVTIDQILSYCTGVCFGTRDYANDMIYTSDGKILVTGSLDGGASSAFSDLLRFNSNGSRDLTFGTNGQIIFFSSGWEIITVTLEEQINQKYLVSFNQYNPLTNFRKSNVNRYNYNGSFDNTFTSISMPVLSANGIFGIVSTLVQKDKKVDVLSVSNTDATGKPYITRLKATGTLDSTFGINGVSVVDTLHILPATDIQLNNLTYFKNDIHGRIILGTFALYQTANDLLFTRLHTGDTITTPDNDECTNAQIITINTPALLNQSTEGATQSLQGLASCNGNGSIANDIWYQFTATATFATITVIGSANFDAVIQAFSSCGSGILACTDATGNGGTETLNLNGLTVGNSYFIRVYEEGSVTPVGSFFSIGVQALQTTYSRYIIRLKNKGSNTFLLSNPIAYLSQRSIDRRIKYGIALDSTDLPVTSSYITQIKNVANVKLLNVSKWINAVTIQTNDANAINTINGFPFVQSSVGIAARFVDPSLIERQDSKFETNFTPIPNSNARTEQINSNYYNYGTSSFNEIHLHNGEFLHNIGLRGQGMQIAVIDNGFNNYTALKAFDSVNINGQVLGTWDFVAREQNVSDDGSHGMNCFSIIAANIPGQFIGKAPKASFWLFQTEDNTSEFPVEELNWACGAERADSSGADVISTSLGYYSFDAPLTGASHVYADMNGNTTMAAIAADLAAKKGLVVFAANGNEGTNSWHFLITPADGDSVVAVGAVSAAGTVGGFSSFGPSSDGQIKPDIASVGVSAVIQTTSNTISTGNGTSFACPNMAGLGTILWQGFPEFNNMKIVRALQQAGSITATPNDRIGYGIPDMKKAFSNLLVDFATSNATINACNVTVNWTSKDVDAMKYEIERKAPGETVYTKVGEINPLTGAILANHSYQFSNTLVSVAAGTVSYRIRQIIDTAAATFTAAYIDTANVTSAGCFPTGTGNPSQNNESVSVQPNPASGKTVTLIIETSYAVADMPIAIYDMNGRLAMQLQKNKGTGKASFDLPIHNLSKGKYIIKVYNNQKTIGTTSLLIL